METALTHDWTRRQFVRGQVYGASDKVAAYPSDRPVYPESLTATIYRAFGIDTAHAIRTRDNRPLNLLDEGAPLPLFG